MSKNIIEEYLRMLKDRERYWYNQFKRNPDSLEAIALASEYLSVIIMSEAAIANDWSTLATFDFYKEEDE